MIHHVSIPANDARHVAEVMTELLDGVLTGFGPYRGGYIAWAGDDVGTAIEVYPRGTEMFPDAGRGQANFRHNPDASPHVATHVNLSVNRTTEEVLALARREGWRAIELPRGPNNVIEFWIENQVMLELMTPEMTRDYVRAARQFR